MLFNGMVADVSKAFQVKAQHGGTGIFFTVMRNINNSAKFIKCVTYNSQLITDLLMMSASRSIYIIVKGGYPDTSYSKDYLNTVTNKQGVYLQHFVVTNAIVDMRELGEDDDEEEEVIKSEKVDNDEAWAEITKDDPKELEIDWDWETKETKTNEN